MHLWLSMKSIAPPRWSTKLKTNQPTIQPTNQQNEKIKYLKFLNNSAEVRVKCSTHHASLPNALCFYILISKWPKGSHGSRPGNSL